MRAKKIISGTIAAFGLLAMIGFCGAQGMTLMQRTLFSLLGLLGLAVGAAVAGALGRKECEK